MMDKSRLYLRDTRPKPNMKPPRRRFQLGERFVDAKDKELYEIVGAYRLKEDPHEWVWLLRSLVPLKGQSPGMLALDHLVELTATAIEPIVVEPFRSSSDASKHFFDLVPRPGFRGDTCHVTNKNLVNSTKWKKEE